MLARFSTRHAVAALVALALLAIPAAAQTEGPPPSLAAILMAKQIVELKGARTMFVPLVRGVVTKVKDMFMQTNFMYAKDLNEVAAIMDKDYSSRVDELVDASARIYARHFTEAELRNLLTFYQTPLGRKVIAEEPKALDESMAYAGAWGDKLSEEVIARMREEMKKRGHDM
jgi:uncharacterized protein